MKKIKLFQVVPDMGTGGGEKVALDISKNIDKEKFDVTIVSLYENKNSLYSKIAEENDINVKYFRKSKGLDIKLILDINEYFRKEKPDVVHTHLGSYPYIIIACIITNVKLNIHTIHNIAEKELPKLHQFIMKCGYKFLGCKPIAISDYIKKTVSKLYNIEDIDCIYNCIDTNRFYPKEVQKDNQKITFINVGRITEQKNHSLLIESFYETYKKNNNCRLKIIGDGNLIDKVQQKINELNMSENIELLGIKYNIEDYMNNADVFVLSSDYEGLPLVVLEAMACGLPIISTKAGGVVDIIEDGKNGILVDVEDKEQLSNAMLNIINNPKVMENMKTESYKKSILYSIDRMVKQYEYIYKKIL